MIQYKVIDNNSKRFGMVGTFVSRENKLGFRQTYPYQIIDLKFDDSIESFYSWDVVKHETID